MRIHTLLALFLIFSLSGCSTYDALPGQDQKPQDDPIDEPDPSALATYDIPMSVEHRGTGLDLDSGLSDGWYSYAECGDMLVLLGWDLAAFEQRDLKINDRFGAYATDLEGRPVQAPDALMDEARWRGALVTTDQGAVYRLTDALVYGPMDQQRFSVTAERVAPGVCDPACDAGRFELPRIGRVHVDLDQGLLMETSGALCGVPSDAQTLPYDLLFEPTAITASQARMTFVAGLNFQDLHAPPQPGRLQRGDDPHPAADRGRNRRRDRRGPDLQARPAARRRGSPDRDRLRPVVSLNPGRRG